MPPAAHPFRLLARGDKDALAAWWLAHVGTLGLPVDPVRRRHLLSYVAVPASVGYVARLLANAPGGLRAAGLAAVVAWVAFLAVAYGSYRAAHDFGRLPAMVRRRPRTALHLTFWLAVAALSVMSAAPARAVLVPIVLVMPFLLWRCGYLLASGARGRVAGTRFRDHVFYLVPAWGGSNVPFGKGAEFLARHQAASSESLARSQVAGLQLIGLGLLWIVAGIVLRGLVYGEADNLVTGLVGGHGVGLRRLGGLIDGRDAGGAAAACLSVYGELMLDTLHIASRGHLYVGVLRMLGYHVPRNTDRPLLAQSVLEFWNRYYFYFKDLMVDCFFMPAFLRCRKWPRLRMVAAVFTAAFIGNVYYHLLQAEIVVATADWWGVWTALESRVFYAALLATGIAVSMHREQQRRSQPDRRRLPAPLRILVVVTFIAVIRIWACDGATAGALPRARFVLSLVGLG